MPKTIAPKPSRLRVIHHPGEAAAKKLPQAEVAVITRLKGPEGDVTSVVSLRWGAKAAYCGRCPEASCTLVDNLCAVAVAGHVASSEAFDLLFVGRPDTGAPDRKNRGA